MLEKIEAIPKFIGADYINIILLVAAVILIGLAVFDIIYTLKSNKKISAVTTRISNAVLQDRAAVDAANAPAVAGVTVTTEQSVGTDIWRIYAIKIVLDDNGLVDDKKLTAMFDNHWEPIQYCNEGSFLLMRQRITKVTQTI